MTRQNISGTSWPSTSTKLITRTVMVTPLPEPSARYEPSGRISETLFSGTSLFSRISTCVSAASSFTRRTPCQSRSSSQIRSMVSTCGNSRIAASSSHCSAAALSVPAAYGMPSSDLVKQLFSGNSRTDGHAAESSAVPTDPNAARFAAVSGTLASDPSIECAASGLARPIVRNCPSRPPCSPSAAASTAACSS